MWQSLRNNWKAICSVAVVVVEYVALHAPQIEGIIETLAKIGNGG